MRTTGSSTGCLEVRSGICTHIASGKESGSRRRKGKGAERTCIVGNSHDDAGSRVEQSDVGCVLRCVNGGGHTLWILQVLEREKERKRKKKKENTYRLRLRGGRHRHVAMRVERLETTAPSPAFGQKGEFIGGYLVDAVVEKRTKVNSDNRLGRIKRHYDSIIYISLKIRHPDFKYII